MLVCLYIIVLPLSSSVIALAADRPGQPRILWYTAASLGIFAAVCGFAAHRLALHRSGYTEGSGVTPITLGLAVPLITALLVRGSRDWPAAQRVAVASAVTAIITPPLALVSHYVLSAFVPAFFACCPS